jgi:erythronate-4-phosphate dehydrogenase
MTLVDEQLTDLADALAAFDEVQVFSGRTFERHDIVRSKTDALIVRSPTSVTPALLENTNVQFVGSATAGIDHVDVGYLAERNITFAHAPGSNAWAVAEYVFATIRTLMTVSLNEQRILHEASANEGLTVGIIGHGNVGSRLARAFAHHGIAHVVHDPPLGIEALGGLAGLLASCDVVTLHVPLTRDGDHPTYHMIGANEMQALRSGTLLINTARGGVIDEDHLRDDVHYVFDVFEDEPNIRPHTAERAQWFTPHVAGYSLDARHHYSRMVGEAWMQWRGLDPARLALPSLTDAIPTSLRPVDQDAARFRAMWTKAPYPATFDEARKLYVLRREVLRHGIPDG